MAMLSFLLIIIGFIFLIKGADFLIDGASSIARQLHISDLVIGLTIVAIGTSSPELCVNIVASFKGNTGIAFGNIFGSTIANIFLVLGCAAIIFPLTVHKGVVWKEIPFSLFAALLFAFLANDQLIARTDVSILTRLDGVLLLIFFVTFLYYAFAFAQKDREIPEKIPSKQYTLGGALLLVVIGTIGLFVGSNLINDGAVSLAEMCGVSDSFIGLTIIALGTSLPELATGVVAAFKKNAEIAVGTVVGSNIFNIFFVLGVSALIRPLPFHTAANIDIGVMVVASIFLFISMFTGGKRIIDRGEGFVFVVLYVGYIAFLVMNA